MNYNSIGSKAIASNKVILISCLLFIALLIGSVISAKAQTLPKQTDKSVKDTTIAGKSYKLYIGSRGGKYTIRTSKNGNVYKAYIKK